jgi:Flp pilus assembly protein TadD
MIQFRFNVSNLLVSAAMAALLLLAPAVHADALQDINKQIKQGQYSQALEQVDKYLAGKPKDAQARFLKGIILTEMNKPNEAIVVFTKLTEDYPELPEPYNNLAVIYAQQSSTRPSRRWKWPSVPTPPMPRRMRTWVTSTRGWQASPMTRPCR